MANPWFETVAEAQRRAKKRLPESVYKAPGRRLRARGRRCGTTSNAFSELGLAPHVVGLHAERDMATTVHGAGHRAAGDLLPDRRAGRAPGRRGGGSPRGRRPRHGDGAVLVRRPSRSRRSSRPTRRRSSSSTGPGRKDDILARVERAQRAGAVGLIVTLDWSFSHRPRLGLAGDPGGDEPQDHGPVRHRRRSPGRAGSTPGPGRCGRRTSPCRTWPSAGRPAPTFFGAYGEWMQHAAADLAGRRLAARAVGRAVHAQGRHPGRRRQARGRRRRQRDLGVQPRRQQPRRHAGHDPGAAGGGRRGRRPDRGAARRRRPARVGRGQGGRAGRPRGDDRPRVPVGAGRQRPGRGGERAGHPARPGSTPALLGLGPLDAQGPLPQGPGHPAPASSAASVPD